MIIDNQQEIIDAIYQEDSIREIYFGNDLVFFKRKEEETHPDDEFDNNAVLPLRGKFSDDSTSEDWWCIKNSTKFDLSEYVNPDTKEFKVDLGNVLFLIGLFEDNDKIERIYKLGVDSPQNSLFGINGIFQNAKGLEYVNADWDITKYKDVGLLFSHTENLKYLDLSSWNITNCTGFMNMISNSGIEHLKIGKWYLNDEAKTTSMFWNDINLTKITGTIHNIRQTLTIDKCPLNNETAVMIINGLAEVDETTYITFSKTTFDTLTDEQKQIATDKGWTIASY